MLTLNLNNSNYGVTKGDKENLFKIYITRKKQNKNRNKIHIHTLQMLTSIHIIKTFQYRNRHARTDIQKMSLDPSSLLEEKTIQHKHNH